MKIVHLCLSCFYIDGFRYQENELVRQHVLDGHDVTVIASTETYGSDMVLCYKPPSTYMGTDGAKVIRMDYSGFFPHAIKKKLRIHQGVYALLQSKSPDIIMFHGLCGWELVAAARYKRNNPGVIFYVDSHEDQNNSATSYLSKNLLHRLYYKNIIRYCLDEIDKVLCVSLETMNFCHEFYGISKGKLEFYPLGGEILSDEDYIRKRFDTRLAYGFVAQDIVFVQSGKMDNKKKLLENLEAFGCIAGKSFKLILVGGIADDISEKASEMIKADTRIQFLGWKPADELYNLLCAADVYVQPGSQSATMQMSLCTRCPVILDDIVSHQPFLSGNGWKANNVESLMQAYQEIAENPALLAHMADVSNKIAMDLLDYKRLANRITK